MTEKLVLLKTYTNEAEAELSRSILAQESIYAAIFKDDAGGMEPELQLIRGVKLMVRAQDLEQALLLINNE